MISALNSYFPRLAGSTHGRSRQPAIDMLHRRGATEPDAPGRGWGIGTVDPAVLRQPPEIDRPQGPHDSPVCRARFA